jgi:enoyl-CoA hydratase
MTASLLGSQYEKYRSLKLSLDGGVMTITISNPGKKNACTPEMGRELSMIWDDVATDPEVKVIVLTGDGADFCAGVDMSDQKNKFADRREASPVHPTTRKARQHVMNILDCEKPTIAKVRGVAYGMGVNMALACDMVFAAQGARLCDSHVKAGMAAGDGGVLLWPLAIGFHRAKQYLMTGEPLLAEQAEQIGLINQCLPDDELDGHVDAMAQRLLELPPHAVNYTKMALNAALKQMTGGAFETSIAYEVYTMGMNDFKEATEAFIERRPGRFEGN